MEKKKVTQEDIMKLLDSCYEKCLNGIPMVSPGVEDMENDYLSKHETKEKACRAMLKNQIAKCTTSGVITGFGGFIVIRQIKNVFDSHFILGYLKDVFFRQSVCFMPLGQIIYW